MAEVDALRPRACPRPVSMIDPNEHSNAWQIFTWPIDFAPEK